LGIPAPGFEIENLDLAGPRFHRVSSNLVSASPHKDELKAKVQKEIDLGRIVDPFQTLPIDSLQILPKSDGKSWRMMTCIVQSKTVQKSFS
jgi:hypothetical protein